MSEIGFYHLTASPLDKALPSLLLKAFEGGYRAVLMVPTAEEMRRLNKQLWTFAQLAFLPHGSAEDAYKEDQPVYLTTEEENPNGANLLAVIDGLEPQFLPGFARVIDMFDGANDEAVAHARKRWKRYKEAGHTLTYWKQDAAGKWEKAG